jgi:hypothetical protein
MNDPLKQSPRKPDLTRLQAIVAYNEASNTRNHRTQIQKQYQTKPFQQQIQKHIQNGASNPKPLLECIEPGPLLTSKPYEKSFTQRRRRNKPFDPENLGRKIFF